MQLRVTAEVYDRVLSFFNGDEQAAGDFVARVFALVHEIDGGNFKRAARRLKLQAAVAKDLSVTTKIFAIDGVEEDERELSSDEPPF